MFFIFGSPRSGTTLLAQALSAHSQIIVPDETDFIVPMAFLYDRIPDPQVGRELISGLIIHSARFADSIGEYLSREEVRDIVHTSDYSPSKILTAIYDRIARNSGKMIAGDKSPNDLLFLRMLIKTESISPQTKIIHIVRNIHDVMPSLKRAGWLNDPDRYFPRFWSNSNLYLHALFEENREQYQLVRYEDLVSAPLETFSNLCTFLGVEFEPDMLSPERRNPRYRGMEIHRHLFEPITTKRIGQYRSAIGWETLREYEKQAAEALQTFGYPLHTQSLLRRIGSRMQSLVAMLFRK
ncbi:MAG: sulfotransferase [Desulfuromonadia bacterium]